MRQVTCLRCPTWRTTSPPRGSLATLLRSAQQDTQLSLFTAPRLSRYASVSGNGSVR